MAIDVVAILTPKPEMVDVAGQVLNELAKTVKAKEPNALKYQPYKAVGPDGSVEYLVLETYTDEAAIENHMAQDHYKDAIARAQSEGLLAKPMHSLKIEPLSEGFLSR